MTSVGSALPSTFTLVAGIVPPSVEELVPGVPDFGVICCMETKSALTIGTMLRSIGTITMKARIVLLVFKIYSLFIFAPRWSVTSTYDGAMILLTSVEEEDSS